MSLLPKSVQGLIDELKRLPGIGPKSAQRLAFHLVVSGKHRMSQLIASLEEARDKTGYCSVCGNLTDTDPCPLCGDPKRDRSLLCVVGYPKDVLAIERAGGYRGLYHVLHGYIEPLKGIGPEDLRVKDLMARLEPEKKAREITEVVLATNPDVDGETTALYLARQIKPLGVKVTRLARGLPFGADLDYADEVTLARSLEARREMQ